MKKKLLIAIVIVLFLSGLTIWRVSFPHDFFPPNRELSVILPSEPLSVCPHLYYGTSIVVDESSYNRLVATILNDTEYDIFFGCDYRIEFYDGYYWRWITSASPFTACLCLIPSSASRTFTHNLYLTVGNLSPGHYRIRRRVFRLIDPSTPARRNYHDLIAEFWIE